jgi:ABC-type methionine transport system permease subunit
MSLFEFFGLMMADLLNQVALWMVFIDFSASFSTVAGVVYGLIQLAVDADSLFPDVFVATLLGLVATFFVSILINFIATIWRVIPFT